MYNAQSYFVSVIGNKGNQTLPSLFMSSQLMLWGFVILFSCAKTLNTMHI